ncbi:MAG: hypothetical protein D4S01_09070 [Dehalococcoidia bacterium]|nr:MAG: hypothetical protein D4S01_09070 [Dehalococcoidia bacterium]
MIAKDRKQFVEIWQSEFNRIRILCNSLPTENRTALNYLNVVRDIEKAFLPIAVKNTYGTETLKAELIGYGYTVKEESEEFTILEKSQYLDNGYGYYFSADIELSINRLTQEIVNILVDSMNAEDINDKLTAITDTCFFMKKYEECKESVNDYPESEEQKQDCNLCTYYSMIDGLYEMLDSGNW